MRPQVSFRPAAVALGALFAAGFLFVVAPMARAQCGTASAPSPCPTPTPTPTPVYAFLSLDVTSGDANTVINVTGGQFLPNEAIGLYWDPHPASASATADANGNFNVRVKPYPGDAPGLHKLCATVQPNPCANFTLLAPTPTALPSPSPSGSPTPTPEVASGAPLNSNPTGGTTLNGLDVITRPPFVFLPLTGAFAIALSFVYWLVSMLRRPRQLKPIPTAAVVHRATRPDYSAGFGAPPAAPATTPDESAWAEPMPQGAPPAPPPGPAPEPPAAQPAPEEPPASPGPAWGPGEPDSGYPQISPPAEPTEWDLPGPVD